MSIKAITTDDLRHMDDEEGLILQGCGGDLQEWLDGINELFTENGILKDDTKFEDISSFEYDGLTCLLYPFEGVKLDIGKLAIWRLQTHATFGGTWLSDYVPNRLGGFITAPALTEEDAGSIPFFASQGKELSRTKSPAKPKAREQQER